MKNVIFLVLDSWNYDEWLDGKRWNLTPFMDELKSKCIWTDGLYSQGPHTEVGLQSLLTGVNTLDVGSLPSFFDFAPMTIFDYFLENGYDVSALFIAKLFFPERLMNDKNFHMYYTWIYNYCYAWNNRLEHFAQIYKERGLTRYEYDCSLFICRRHLKLLLDWFEGYESNPSRYEMLSIDLDKSVAQKMLAIIKQEIETFECDESKYIYTMLSNFAASPLNIIDKMINVDKKHDKTIEYIKQTYGDVLKELERKQKKNNCYNWSLKYYISYIVLALKVLRGRLTGYYETQYYWQECLRRVDDSKYFDMDIDKEIHMVPSMNCQVDFVLNLIKEKRESNIPFFIYLQPEELHRMNNWYSYDSSDRRLIDDEFKSIKELIGTGACDRAGYLPYTLALRYVDRCIKKLFEGMQELDVMKNTIIVITADHGSSFGHGPIRNALSVNNFYDENYHIPLLVYSNGEELKLSGLFENRDVLPTILHLAGIESDDRISGHTMLKKGRSIVHSEYWGPGCKDIVNNPIWFTARNYRYKIHYKVFLKDEFKSGKLLGIYDISTDKLEKRNLLRKIKKNEINDLLEYLRIRHAQLKEMYKSCF